MRLNQLRNIMFKKTRITTLFVCLLLTMNLIITPTGVTAASTSPIKVQITYYDEWKILSTREISFPADQEPRIVNGRTLIPLRTISEQLGYTDRKSVV